MKCEKNVKFMLIYNRSKNIDFEISGL